MPKNTTRPTTKGMKQERTRSGASASGPSKSKNTQATRKTRSVNQRRDVVPNRVKLLVSILNTGDEVRMAELINDFSVSMSFSVNGRGTAHGAVLSYLGIGDSDKRVLFSLIPESDEHDILKTIRDEMYLFLVGRGISFTVPLTGLTEHVQSDILSASAGKSLEGKRIMKDKDRKYELIVAVVQNGYADEAMEAARKVGAAGGTILESTSVNNAKAEQFLGISLHDESEMLLILARRDMSDNIMNALVEGVGLKTDARGVVFSLPVDRTVGVGGIENASEGVAGTVTSSASADEPPEQAAKRSAKHAAGHAEEQPEARVETSSEKTDSDVEAEAETVAASQSDDAG